MNKFFAHMAPVMFGCCIVASLYKHLVAGAPWSEVIMWCALYSIARMVEDEKN
jgi:hypothetical protein